MTGKRVREVPWCAIFLVSVAVIAHTVTLIGNLATAHTFVEIGKATGGWSDVGLGVSESAIHEMEYLMDQTAKMLTDGLEKIIQIDSMLGFILGSAGNTTQQAIHLLQSGDEQAIQEFIENPVAFTEITVNEIEGIPTVEMKTPDTSNMLSSETLSKERRAAL